MNPRVEDRAAPRSGSAPLLAGAVSIVVGIRLWATSPARFPLIVADEAAYLSMARELGEGNGWNLGRAATYGPAYSVLIAPWSAFHASPDTVYRAAIWTNIAVAVGGFLLLEAIVRRLSVVERPWSILIATTATLTPALVVNSAYAWSDSLAVAAFLLLVYASIRLTESPTMVMAVAVALAATAAYGVHGRFAPAALVTLGLFGVLAWRRALLPGPALAAAATLVIGVVTVSIASGALYGALYAPGGQVRQTTGALGRALRVWTVALTASGQLWYLLATTAGVAGLGVIALLAASRPGAVTVAQGVVGGGGARITASLILITFLTSAGFMAGRDGADKLIYGRYNDAVVGVLIALGLARLSSPGTGRRRLGDLGLVAGATAGTALLIRVARPELLAQPYNGITIRSMLVFGPGGPRQVPHHTMVALALVALLALAGIVAAARPRVLLVVALALAAVGTYRGVDLTLGPRRGDPRAAVRLAQLVPSTERVAYLRDQPVSLQGFYRYPFYAPDLHLYLTSRAVRATEMRWIMAPADRSDIAAAGYELVWTDEVAGQGLWRFVER